MNDSFRCVCFLFVLSASLLAQGPRIREAYPQTTERSPWPDQRRPQSERFTEPIPTRPRREALSSDPNRVTQQQPRMNDSRHLNVPATDWIPDPTQRVDSDVAKRSQDLRRLQLSIQQATTESEPSREQLGKKLDELLTEIFEADLQERDKKLAALEERVKKLRGAIEKRRENRDRIIHLQSETIMLSAEGLSFPGIATTTPDETWAAALNRDRRYVDLRLEVEQLHAEINRIPAVERPASPRVRMLNEQINQLLKEQDKMGDEVRKRLSSTAGETAPVPHDISEDAKEPKATKGF